MAGLQVGLAAGIVSYYARTRRQMIMIASLPGMAAGLQKMRMMIRPLIGLPMDGNLEKLFFLLNFN